MPKTHTTLPGIESIELGGQENSLALLEHFGIGAVDFADTQPDREITLAPIEKDEVAAALQAWRQQVLRRTLGARK